MSCFLEKIQNKSNTNTVGSLPEPEAPFPDFISFSYGNLEFSVTYKNKQLFFSKSREYANSAYQPYVAIHCSQSTLEKIQDALREILPLVKQNSDSTPGVSIPDTSSWFSCELSSGEKHFYLEPRLSRGLNPLGKAFLPINERIFYYDTEAYYILCTLYDNDICGERTVAAVSMNNGAAATGLLSSAYAHAPHGGGRERWLYLRSHTYEDIRRFAKDAYQEKPAEERDPERFAELNGQTWKTYLVF